MSPTLMAGGGGSGALGGFGAVPTPTDGTTCARSARASGVLRRDWTSWSPTACYGTAVTPRHLILVISSVAVLAAGLYLFKEVRATPAPTEVSKRTSPPTPPAPADEEPEARTPEKLPER